MSVLQTEFVGRITLLRDKVQGAENHPFNLPALKDFEQMIAHPKVTFFVGENGSGKSTLLEAIAISLGMNAEGGTGNFVLAPAHRIPVCMKRCALPKVLEGRKRNSFCARKAISI